MTLNHIPLSYVLDYFKIGVKISKKEPGKIDFKEQQTTVSISANGTNAYTPQISN